MNPLRRRMMWAVLACSAAWLNGREAGAQSLGNGGAMTPIGASSPAPSSAPISVPLFTPTVPSAMSDPTATGSSSSNGLMSSPFAMPFLYSSMLQASQPYSMSNATTGSTTTGSTATNTGGRYGMGMGMNPAQLGLLMLATQNNGGVGSGRMSGARSGTQNSATTNMGISARRRTPAKPGGLAGRYFNRIPPHSPYPQSYFNRQNRYFP